MHDWGQHTVGYLIFPINNDIFLLFVDVRQGILVRFGVNLASRLVGHLILPFSFPSTASMTSWHRLYRRRPRARPSHKATWRVLLRGERRLISTFLGRRRLRASSPCLRFDRWLHSSTTTSRSTGRRGLGSSGWWR